MSGTCTWRRVQHHPVHRLHNHTGYRGALQGKIDDWEKVAGVSPAAAPVAWGGGGPGQEGEVEGPGRGERPWSHTTCPPPAPPEGSQSPTRDGTWLGMFKKQT